MRDAVIIVVALMPVTLAVLALHGYRHLRSGIRFNLNRARHNARLRKYGRRHD